MDVFIKGPEATAEQIAGSVLLPHLSYAVSLFLTYPVPFSSPHVSLLSVAGKENPEPVGQRARQPVSRPVGSAEGPANHHLLLLMSLSITRSTCWD